MYTTRALHEHAVFALAIKDENGSPHAWSVGANGVDEGGSVTRNRDEGDRVWMTSPLEE